MDCAFYKKYERVFYREWRGDQFGHGAWVYYTFNGQGQTIPVSSRTVALEMEYGAGLIQVPRS